MLLFSRGPGYGGVVSGLYFGLPIQGLSFIYGLPYALYRVRLWRTYPVLKQGLSGD